MTITRIFSIYDDSGEKAVVTFTGETVEDAEDVAEIDIYDDKDRWVGTLSYRQDMQIREVK
jgi:hypothetical protein